ncbi:MAG: glycosyltransferase family 2 protein [Bdellovibrionales bacterium]|nr:glycosyltransferase family 2 protein [Bdellovibrionales bacterium]
MSLSVVIPARLHSPTLLRLLESLKSQSLQEFETLVVFDGEFKGSATSLHDLAGLKVLCSPVSGANGARNLGMDHAAHSLVQLIDDDCVVNDPYFLQNVLGEHQKHPEAVAIGGPYALTKSLSLPAKAYNIIANFWQRPQKWSTSQNSRLLGGNVSYKKDRLDKLSLRFNDSIDYGGSEAEFHQRLSVLGESLIFSSQLVLSHQPQMTEQQLIEKAKKQATTSLQFPIDSGFDRQLIKTYQCPKKVAALRWSRDPEEFKNLCRWIDLYDRAYQQVWQGSDRRPHA